LNLKIALVGMALITFLTSFCSCINTTGVAQKAELAILKKELTKNEAGNTVVLVTIKNIGSVNAELAEVRVTFYDAQRDIIDSSRDSILNLKPDKTWEFTLSCSGERCSQIKSYDVETTAGTSSGGL
jgi:hypothetical protein